MKELLGICLCVLSWQLTFSQSPDAVLSIWHKAASEAQFDAYFDCMADSSIFWGTDKSEHWTKQEFMEYSKPHFDKGKAWDFKVVNRHGRYLMDSTIYIFEEELDTWMGDARGSGVLMLIDGKWLILQYNLSLPIPNEKMREVIQLIAR